MPSACSWRNVTVPTGPALLSRCTAVGLFRRIGCLLAAHHAGCPAMLAVSAATLFVLCLQACTRHGTAPTASAALGRALLGSLLMGCFREETEKTQVTFNGNGILAGIQVSSAQAVLD